MKRFFIEHSEIMKDSPVIDGQDAHHIAKVFRLKPEDHILLIDGSGMEYEAEIIELSKNQVNVSIIKKFSSDTESPVQIMVGQGYLKDKKMDMLIRHLTEIGIAKWMPVISEYSVPQPDSKRIDSRTQRWEIIAKEAVKQCRRTRVPEIVPPVPFQEAVKESISIDLKIIFYENETVSLAKTIIPLNQKPVRIFVLLGPEGGFSNKEVELAKSNGFIIASLGPRILRAETASISACTLIQHLFGDMC
ncbi:MAG: 16S rRNA (uracil(1498)-N(3))-methyltransferase [Desulfobacteraceae bacterium]|nr:16S rRNA (uracil(1498)-N(3))-methyltransferase [Desulfobacteraceae bacterium]MBC2757990.1 16S rRNA (uracil(1498)-N(3))-methyltransferase [Desulfobacteraceae bacterium]